MEKANLEDSPPLGSLVPYYMHNDSDNSIEPWCYNGITKWGNYDQIRASSENSDPFNINMGETIDEQYGPTPCNACLYAMKADYFIESSNTLPTKC